MEGSDRLAHASSPGRRLTSTSGRRRRPGPPVRRRSDACSGSRSWSRWSSVGSALPPTWRSRRVPARARTASRRGSPTSRARPTIAFVIAPLCIAGVSALNPPPSFLLRSRPDRRRRGFTVLGVGLYRAFGGTRREDPARMVARATLVLSRWSRCSARRRGSAVRRARRRRGGGGDLDRRRARPDRRRPARRAAMAHPSGDRAGHAAGRRLRRRPRPARRRGEHTYRPTSVAALRSAYRLGVGQHGRRPARWGAARRPTEVKLRLGMGEARVHVPAGVCVRPTRRSAWAPPTCPSASARARHHDSSGDRPPRPACRSCSSTRTSASGTCRSTARPAAREAWRADRTLIVAGLAAVALGALLLLDRTVSIDIRFDYCSRPCSPRSAPSSSGGVSSE